MSGKYRAAADSGTPEAKADTIWEHLPAEQRYAARANVDVYLEGFISVIQGGPRERCQILWHLFHQINRVFFPNKEADTDRKDPISQKKLGQGYGAQSTIKTFLGWDLVMIAHLLRLLVKSVCSARDSG